MMFFLSPQGRISRAQWWGGIVCLIVVNLVLGWILWSSYGASLFLSSGGRTTRFFLTLPLLYPAYCLAAKRFQDRDKSAALAQVPFAITALKLLLDFLGLTGDPWDQNGLDVLFMIVQGGIGIWFIIELGCLRGSEGENAYGFDPLGYRAPAHVRTGQHQPPYR